MTDYTDLIARLREWDKTPASDIRMLTDFGPVSVGGDMGDAAAAIEALQAELEATCAALKVAIDEAAWMVTQRDADTAEIEALQAELDRVMQAAVNGGYCRRTHYQAGGTV